MQIGCKLRGGRFAKGGMGLGDDGIGGHKGDTCLRRQILYTRPSC